MCLGTVLYQISVNTYMWVKDKKSFQSWLNYLQIFIDGYYYSSSFNDAKFFEFQSFLFPLYCPHKKARVLQGASRRLCWQELACLPSHCCPKTDYQYAALRPTFSSAVTLTQPKIRETRHQECLHGKFGWEEAVLPTIKVWLYDKLQTPQSEVPVREEQGSVAERVGIYYFSSCFQWDVLLYTISHIESPI